MKYKEPLVLYYFEELSYQEIADILQIPVSTVGIRIKRAKEKVKTIYGQITSNDGK
jgi:RNA polymerase sigma-70 factor (ECF subfamily)